MWLSVVKFGKPEWLNPCECQVVVLLCTDFGRGEVCVGAMSVLRGEWCAWGRVGAIG